MTHESTALAAAPSTDETGPARLLRAGIATGAAAVIAVGLAASPALAQSSNQTTGAQSDAQGQQIEISAEKRQKIERLLDLTRVDRTVEQIKPLAAKQMGNMLQKRAPKMGDGERTQLIKTVATTFEAGRDELTQALVPVYAKTFSTEELDHMLGFYDSPTGQKIAAKLPRAVGMARQISRKWSQQMAQQAFQQVKQDAADLGYKL